jgi:hypothetical protein
MSIHHYIRQGTPCAKPGCQKIHAARSKYCSEHLKEARGKRSQAGECGTLALAQALLDAPDLPQQLNRSQWVSTLNLATWQIKRIEVTR